MEIFLLVQPSPSQAETYLFSIAKRRLSNAMDDSIIRYAIINSFSFKERVDFHTLKKSPWVKIDEKVSSCFWKIGNNLWKPQNNLISAILLILENSEKNKIFLKNSIHCGKTLHWRLDTFTLKLMQSGMPNWFFPSFHLIEFLSLVCKEKISSILHFSRVLHTVPNCNVWSIIQLQENAFMNIF